jgi:hypothetical protein
MIYKKKLSSFKIAFVIQKQKQPGRYNTSPVSPDTNVTSTKRCRFSPIP